MQNKNEKSNWKNQEYVESALNAEKPNEQLNQISNEERHTRNAKESTALQQEYPRIHTENL